MKAAQELYEGVEVAGHGTLGLITYMRTDSLRISEEARAAGNAFITETYGEKYLPKKPRYFKSKSNIQDGHEAIRPTTPSITPEMVKGSVTTDPVQNLQAGVGAVYCLSDGELPARDHEN